jgi:hypothetical protein
MISPVKFYSSILMGALALVMTWASAGGSVQSMEKPTLAVESAKVADVLMSQKDEALPSFSAGVATPLASLDANGKEDINFDKEQMRLMENARQNLSILKSSLNQKNNDYDACIKKSKGCGLRNVIRDLLSDVSQVRWNMDQFNQSGKVSMQVSQKFKALDNDIKKVSTKWPGLIPPTE